MFTLLFTLLVIIVLTCMALTILLGLGVFGAGFVVSILCVMLYVATPILAILGVIFIANLLAGKKDHKHDKD